jgi:hypothetical protein
MTAWELAAAARRMWAVVLLGLLATAGLLWHVAHGAPVYSGEVTVVLLSDAIGSDLRQVDQGLVTTAAVVSRRVSAGMSAGVASDSVSLVGVGIRHGYSVTLPNRGSQWSKLYDRPELRVQVAGTSVEEVHATLSLALRRIAEALAMTQAEVGVTGPNLVRTQLTPTVPDIREGRGSRTRAGAAALLLGMGATTAAVVVLDSRRTRRERQLRELVASPVLTPELGPGVVLAT